MPYQYWWPNSWIVTSSIPLTRSKGQRRIHPGEPPVMNVGYSMPPAPMPSSGGSTIVSVS